MIIAQKQIYFYSGKIVDVDLPVVVKAMLYCFHVDVSSQGHWQKNKADDTNLSNK